MKRVTIEERDRMVRTRAVPDNFNNLQAIHSSYGALHGIGASVSPPNLGLMGHPYGSHEARPLMLGLRSSAVESNVSPNGLSQSLSGINIGQPGSVPSPNIVPLSNNLYNNGYTARSSTPSPTPGLEYQASTTYWNSTADKMGIPSPHSHPGIRDSQSPQCRDWSSRQTHDSCLSLYNRSATSAPNSSSPQVSYPTSSTGTLGTCETQSYSG